MTDTLRVSFDVQLGAAEAFALLADELKTALERLHLDFHAGQAGHITERGATVGEIDEWTPARRVVMRWRPASWNPQAAIEVVLLVEPLEHGARITFEQRGWGALLGSPAEHGAWVASEVLARMLSAATPAAFGDWFTDRYARRPFGSASRATYADPLYHYPNFRVILSELALDSNAYLLEVGCGGGALLTAALATGCRAAAIDHSADMVRLARHSNRDAVGDGRLHVVIGSAEGLPLTAATFTHAAMTGVLGFLRDPVAAFAEIRRVLTPGGVFVSLGSDPELRGTPGAPEPMASRLRFYDSEELESMARDAGFAEVRVLRRDLEQYAREAGVPDEHVPLFAAGAGGGARFLVCRS